MAPRKQATSGTAAATAAAAPSPKLLSRKSDSRRSASPVAAKRGRSRSAARPAATKPAKAAPASRAAAAASATTSTPAKAAAASAPHVGPPHYEFFGPYLGPISLLFFLPALVWWTARYCTAEGWPHPALSWPPSAALLPSWADIQASISIPAFGVYCAWFALQAALHVVVPGRVVQGTQLADGSRLPYKVNGWRCFLVTHAVLAVLHVTGVLPLPWIHAHCLQLATASCIFAIGLSVFLYLWSFARGAKLAPGGNTGIGIYDFFIGRELNPRLGQGGYLPTGTLDLKYFCELRPGLFLWHVINVSCAMVEVQRTGGLSLAMALVIGAQALYVADAVLAEESILTTIDITTDGFGFMLAVGDLAWLPFMYSLQARFLVDFPQALSVPYACFCAAVALGGFVVFRLANSQKDAFKTDPTNPAVKSALGWGHWRGWVYGGGGGCRGGGVALGGRRWRARRDAKMTLFNILVACNFIKSLSSAPLTTHCNTPTPPTRRIFFYPDLRSIRTPTGSRLLADGWWGASRHVNYLADWLLSVGMSLPTCEWAVWRGWLWHRGKGS